MNNLIRLIIADDHPVVRDGIKSILYHHDTIHVVGEAGSGMELVEMCHHLQPDVVLTDVVMYDGIDGEAATKLLTEQCPLVKVIAMSIYDRYYDIIRMINAGAIGYISKNASKEEYIEAIEHVHTCKVYYCKRIKKRMQAAGPNIRRLYKAVEFSEKELQVLSLLCKGKDNAEVAASLELSVRTIEGYRLKMLEKFETRNILKVMFYAISTGLVRIDEAE